MLCTYLHKAITPTTSPPFLFLSLSLSQTRHLVTFKWAAICSEHKGLHLLAENQIILHTQGPLTGQRGLTFMDNTNRPDCIHVNREDNPDK